MQRVYYSCKSFIKSLFQRILWLLYILLLGGFSTQFKNMLFFISGLFQHAILYPNLDEVVLIANHYGGWKLSQDSLLTQSYGTVLEVLTTDQPTVFCHLSMRYELLTTPALLCKEVIKWRVIRGHSSASTYTDDWISWFCSGDISFWQNMYIKSPYTS